MTGIIRLASVTDTSSGILKYGEDERAVRENMSHESILCNIIIKSRSYLP
jgi:hypothetical protein